MYLAVLNITLVILMKLFNKATFIKYIFIFVAVVITVSFWIVSNEIAKDLAVEERQKIELWSNALEMAASGDDGGELNLTLKILSSNKTIPVILCDDDDNVLLTANVDVPVEDSLLFLQKTIHSFKRTNAPIVIQNDEFKQYVYYGDSYTLKRLQYFPFIQIGILTIFVCVSFLAFLSIKNAEQNRVWVGLSKETAHQLGTPISSMFAWVDYLKSKDSGSLIFLEMEKDVMRLQMVADRFSKIGSRPSPERMDVSSQVIQSVSYLEKRISKKVEFLFNIPDCPIYANISSSLFSWVIENLTKNAVDAMEGVGKISYSVSQSDSMVYVDITDTGKGISRSKYKQIFSPGYTTKQRGWGLGLSLTKRIIEDYHKGKVFVKHSELGVGTTFRIELKKSINS